MSGLQRPRQRRAKPRRLTDGTAARLRAVCPKDMGALTASSARPRICTESEVLNIVSRDCRQRGSVILGVLAG